MTHFQILLRQIMREHGLNQQKLADKLGMRQSQISNYLNGKSKPSYDIIREISRVFKISADEVCDTAN